MNAFEQLIAPTKQAQAEFAQDCVECFTSGAGKRVLAALVAAAHPLCHIPGMTDHEHGRAEVVATLWRFGANTPQIPAPQQTPPTQ